MITTNSRHEPNFNTLWYCLITVASQIFGALHPRVTNLQALNKPAMRDLHTTTRYGKYIHSSNKTNYYSLFKAFPLRTRPL